MIFIRDQIGGWQTPAPQDVSVEDSKALQSSLSLQAKSNKVAILAKANNGIKSI